MATVSNHTMILRLIGELPAEVLELDYLTGLDWTDKDLLMQRAINRFVGLRAGLLRISRLNLMSVEGLDLPSDEVESLRRAEFAHSTRAAVGYLDDVLAGAPDRRPCARSGSDRPTAAGAGLASTPASRRCSGVIGAGASVSGSTPPPDFGKAITSRIESVPDSSAQIRSQPNAIPPCGGAP